MVPLGLVSSQSGMELPWVMRCCGDAATGARDLEFVYVPFLGYVYGGTPGGGSLVQALLAATLVLGLAGALLARAGTRRLGPRWAAALAVAAALAAPLVPWAGAGDVTVRAVQSVLGSVAPAQGELLRQARAGMSTAAVMTQVYSQGAAMEEENRVSNLTYTPVVSRGLLSPEEARGVVRFVHRQRARWDHRFLRAGPLPFFTFGATTSLEGSGAGDGGDGGGAYRERVRQHNPLLSKELGWIYERVRRRMERELGMAVRFHEVNVGEEDSRGSVDEDDSREDPEEAEPMLALPGFQIYLSNAAFQLPVGQAHLDNNHNNGEHEWPPGADKRHVISFTLALDLPRAPPGEGAAGRGGEPTRSGLWTYQLKPPAEEELEGGATFSKHEGTYQHYNRDRGVPVKAGTREGVIYRVHHPYEVGTIVIHSGHLVHQACYAPSGWYSGSDSRITLQGFGIFDAEKQEWVIYW